MNVQMYLPQLPFANVIFRKRTASMGATVLLAPSEGNPTEVAAHVLSLQGPVGQRPSLRIFWPYKNTCLDPMAHFGRRMPISVRDGLASCSRCFLLVLSWLLAGRDELSGRGEFQIRKRRRRIRMGHRVISQFSTLVCVSQVAVLYTWFKVLVDEQNFDRAQEW